jgi:geranylgeranyl pyrophosphate synthase
MGYDDSAVITPAVKPAGAASLKFESLHQHFESEIREVDRALVTYFSRFNQPAHHYGMVRYHFGYAGADLRALDEAGYLPRGKRLRPLICMLFCRMFRLGPDIAATVMMATEVMHSASLAHDDIEDQDAARWGRPTLQSLFGVEQAINVGDALIGVVYQIVLTLRSQGVPAPGVLEVIEVFNETHLRMCEGQHLDLRYHFFDDVSVEEYLDMVGRKTAAACVCIADAISILAACPPESRDALRRFGHSLGVLYQICDDVRGIWCMPKALGRQIGQDVNRERASLPLLLAFKHGSQGLRDALRSASGREEALTEEELAFIRQELADCGVSGFCEQEARKHYEAALTALEELDVEGPEVEVLRAILGSSFASVDFVV